MNAKYTIRRGDYGVTPQLYEVLNPSGVPIAPCLSWRVARKIADLYNADVEVRRIHKLWQSYGDVSLQEEA